MNKAFFLDRDGIINKIKLINNIPQSPRKYKDFILNFEIESILNFLKIHKFLNIIITNQPDISRGLLSLSDLLKMNLLIYKKLNIDDIFICPHDDSANCNCRKPKPGLLIKAIEKYNIDINNSFFLGDTKKDILAGKSINCKTLLLSTEYNKDIIYADFVINSFNDIYSIINNGGKK